jgi:isoleucyl-tRNA synthetase
VRAYADAESEGRESALAMLQLALRVFLRLFAPALPFVTEEVWSWRFAGAGRERSIHTSPWPTAGEFAGIPLERAALRAVLADVLGAGSVDASACRLESGPPAEGALFATTVELAEQATDAGERSL